MGVVGDDQDARAAVRQAGQAAQQIVRSGGVEVRGRLVEDQEVGVGEEEAGDGDPLALPARDPRPGLADLGLEPLGQRVEPLAEADRGERRGDLGVAGAGAADRDVVAQGGREEVGVLGREADRGADVVAVAARAGRRRRG